MGFKVLLNQRHDWKSGSQSQDEEWGGTELLEAQWVSTVGGDVGSCCLLVSVHCVLSSPKSTQLEIFKHFIAPSADTLYGDADFLFQRDLALVLLYDRVYDALSRGR